MTPSCVVVVVVVVVLTLTPIIESVVTGEAPVTVEWKNKNKENTHTESDTRIPGVYIGS